MACSLEPTVKYVWFDRLEVHADYVDIQTSRGDMQRCQAAVHSRCTVQFQMIPPVGVDTKSLLHRMELAMDALIDEELLQVKRREEVLGTEYEPSVTF